MGNRANFVIVKDHDWQLYYSHWGGCRMLDALIGGPEFVLRYAASLRRCEKNEWCDSRASKTARPGTSPNLRGCWRLSHPGSWSAPMP